MKTRQGIKQFLTESYADGVLVRVARGSAHQRGARPKVTSMTLAARSGAAAAAILALIFTVNTITVTVLPFYRYQILL